MQTTTPPGQTFAKRWAIYAALGVPTIDLETWRLRTSGLVEKELNLSFRELQNLPQVKFTRDFSCVTTWSIKDVVWEGVALRELAKLAGFSSTALHTTPLRVEERQMADRDRVPLRVPRWILGGILLPRTWKYLERRTFQRPGRQARP